MADPYKSLAAVFRQQMAGYAKDMLSGMSTELGTITASGLKLDHFKHEIKSYWVADFPVTLEIPAFHMVGTMMSPVDQEGFPLEYRVRERVLNLRRPRSRTFALIWPTVFSRGSRRCR